MEQEDITLSKITQTLKFSALAHKCRIFKNQHYRDEEENSVGNFQRMCRNREV
jgi:hypothetical protein